MEISDDWQAGKAYLTFTESTDLKRGCSQLLQKELDTIYPSREEIADALLRELAENGEEAEPNTVYHALANHFNLTEDERQAKSKKSPNIIWENCVAWTRLALVKSGDMDGPKRGIWRITQKGLERVNKSIPPDDVIDLLSIATRTRNILLYGPPELARRG